MPISRERRKQLRKEALSLVWQVLDAKFRDVDLWREGLTDDELDFISSVIDSKAQRAFNEYEDYKQRVAK